MFKPPPSPLLLRPIVPLEDGHVVEPLLLTETVPGGRTVGRTSAADWTIPHLSISRRHAAIEAAGGEWFISDLGSRHGTFVNAQRIAPGDKLPVRPGDEIRFGLWACRCEAGGAPASRRTSVADDPAGRPLVKRVSASELSGIAQKRLDALIEAGRELQTAADRVEVAETLVRCAAAGSGCSTVVLVRPVAEGEFEQLAPADPARPVRLSRSLLDAAAEGEVVMLSEGASQFKAAQSIIDLGIRSAICAPLMIAGRADSFLYLDTRGAEGSLAKDITSFCGALAQLGAMATERLAAAELRSRREQLERDLAGARRAQQLLMPARSGTRPGLTYCFESIPGRYVAGDLFDLVSLPDGRTAFFLGDVSGKGVGAGLLMAAAQTHLRTLLAHGVGLAEAVTSLNEHVHERTETATFLTLIAGLYDPRGGCVAITDAGHGLCFRSGPLGADRITLTGGLPIGVAGDRSYAAEEIVLRPGERLILLSDGVVEQPSPQGEPFGMEAVLARLGAESDPGADVAALLGAVREHAAGPFADDFTVVSFAATGA